MDRTKDLRDLNYRIAQYCFGAVGDEVRGLLDILPICVGYCAVSERRLRALACGPAVGLPGPRPSAALVSVNLAYLRYMVKLALQAESHPYRLLRLGMSEATARYVADLSEAELQRIADTHLDPLFAPTRKFVAFAAEAGPNLDGQLRSYLALLSLAAA
jgi:hypothetical protein